MTKNEKKEIVEVFVECFNEVILPPFDLLNTKITKIKGKITNIEENTTSLEDKVENIEESLNNVQLTVDKIERTQRAEINRSDNHEERIKKLELHLV